MIESDERLIRRYLDGDEGALTSLVTRWERPVHALAYRLVGDREEARDIGQKALVRLVHHLPSFRENARFSTWFYRIVINLCRDHGRSRLARESALSRFGARLAARRSASTFEIYEKDARAREVATAVAALPADLREAVVLRHYHELTFAEVAAVLDTPVPTIKSRVVRGLERLERRLRSPGPRNPKSDLSSTGTPS